MVTNTGDEDLTVTLSASQDSDCNGFTSNLAQTVFAVGQGSPRQRRSRSA